VDPIARYPPVQYNSRPPPVTRRAVDYDPVSLMVQQEGLPLSDMASETADLRILRIANIGRQLKAGATNLLKKIFYADFAWRKPPRYDVGPALTV
jgi:hypothetical protein